MTRSGVPATNDGSATQLDTKDIRQRVLRLAWPVIGENLLETTLFVVDTLLVARLGADAIAGVGSAMQILFFLISILSALAIGSSVLVAQAIGGGNLPQANSLARQSLVWSVLLSVPLAACGLLFSRPIIDVFGLTPEVARIALAYMHVTMGTVIVLVGLIIGGGVLRGAGDSRTPMLVTAFANVINVGLAYGLIYGHFGLPALGAVGSAWATFIARGLALLLLLALLWRGRNGVTIKGMGGWLPDLKIARQVLQLGVPAALEQVLTSAGFLVLGIIVAHLGTTMLAAFRLAFTALSFAFLPGFGFGIAATALVGQSVGARRMREGVVATHIATAWAVAWMSVGAVLSLLFAPQLIAVFSSDSSVQQAGTGALRMVALSMPFWAVLFVQSGGLRGAGNTRFPLLVSGSGIWASVGIAALLIATVGGGLISIWAAFVLVSPFTATLMWRQFHRTAAKIIDSEANGAPA
ncbi:MAG: MATE family efflux transporter [Herpetosiphonaceae bacterium]|nr:MATE family efflux transporter [Herpetosiphonaceae bacterium]